MTTRKKSDVVLQELRAFGLSYPGAHTRSPWPGHRDLAVKDKTFTYRTQARKKLLSMLTAK